jgi:hypothetical protein
VASTRRVATTASSVSTTTPQWHHESTLPSTAATAAANTRRTFLVETIVTAASTVGGLTVVVVSPPSALAVTTDIKVTPVAHTFLTSSGTAKPIRENDATRYFTNARVVYLLEGATASNINLARDVVERTIQRKAEEGPGVTKGKVELLTPQNGDDSSSIVKTVTQFVKSMSGAGDVVLVGPLPSKGTVQDGKLLADTAAALGTFVGGKREGGVISVLLDGPRQGLRLEEGGYPISDLLWYSLPPAAKSEYIVL